MKLLAPIGNKSNLDYEKVVFVNKYSDAFFDYCKKNIKKVYLRPEYKLI